MHADVTSDKPAKCNKCGMDLVKSKKEQMKTEVTKSYSCPMHADITSDKPGSRYLFKPSRSRQVFNSPPSCRGLGSFLLVVQNECRWYLFPKFA